MIDDFEPSPAHTMRENREQISYGRVLGVILALAVIAALAMYGMAR